MLMAAPRPPGFGLHVQRWRPEGGRRGRLQTRPYEVERLHAVWKPVYFQKGQQHGTSPMRGHGHGTLYGHPGRWHGVSFLCQP
jgi:hypothetical protein